MDGEGGMKERKGVGERGTQQGHLPRAIWWLRRFYTVVFVCLFRLGISPVSAAGRPSVMIYLPHSLPLRFTTLTILLSVFLSFYCCYPRNLLVVVIVTDGRC